MSFKTQSEQDETNLEDLENIDISKVIQSRYKQRRQGVSLRNIQQLHLTEADHELQPSMQTQIGQTTQTELLTKSDRPDNEQKIITFRCANISVAKIKKKQDKTIFSEQNSCRICGDGDSEEMPLIKACECVRSRYFVHEECLKQQILDEYNYKIRNAQCSSCQVKYNMTIEGSFVFLPKLGWEQSKDKIPLFCLITFQIVLLIIVILLGIRLPDLEEQNNRSNFLHSRIFIILFIIICAMISVILIWLIVMILRNIIYVEKITKWKIYPYVAKQQTFAAQQNIEIDQNGMLHLKQLIQEKKEDFSKSEYNKNPKLQYKRYFTSQRTKESII